jgi:hypothetical protein
MKSTAIDILKQLHLDYQKGVTKKEYAHLVEAISYWTSVVVLELIEKEKK